MEERDKARGAKERAEIFAEQCAALEAQGFVPHDRSMSMSAANICGTLAALPFIAAAGIGVRIRRTVCAECRVIVCGRGGIRRRDGGFDHSTRMSARVVLGGGQRRRSQTGLRPTHFHAVLCSTQTYGEARYLNWHNRTFRVFRRRLFRCRHALRGSGCCARQARQTS